MEDIDIELYAGVITGLAIAVALLLILTDYTELNDDDFNEIL